MHILSSSLLLTYECIIIIIIITGSSPHRVREIEREESKGIETKRVTIT